MSIIEPLDSKDLATKLADKPGHPGYAEYIAEPRTAPVFMVRQGRLE